MSNQNPEANSADPTDVRDRAMPDGGTATPAPPSSQTQPRWDANSGSQTSVVPAAAGAGLVAVIVVAIIRWLKARHVKPTASERLAEAGKTLGTASLKLGDRAGDRLGDVTGEVKSRAPEVASRAADLAGDVADYVTSRAPDLASKTADVASQAANAATEVGGKAVSAATEVGGKAVTAAKSAGGGVGDAAGAIAGGAEHVYDRTTTWINRLLLLLIGFLGYVLGAAAGRERYEQIAGLARSVANRPEVQQAKGKVQQTVREQTGMGSGASAGSSAS